MITLFVTKFFIRHGYDLIVTFPRKPQLTDGGLLDALPTIGDLKLTSVIVGTIEVVEQLPSLPGIILLPCEERQTI